MKPKSEIKFGNGGKLGPVRQNMRLPPKIVRWIRQC